MSDKKEKCDYLKESVKVKFESVSAVDVQKRMRISIPADLKEPPTPQPSKASKKEK